MVYQSYVRKKLLKEEVKYIIIYYKICEGMLGDSGLNKKNNNIILQKKERKKERNRR